MLSTSSFMIIVALARVTRASGIGKAWEVSPVKNSENPSSLSSSRARLESSAFEVRSVSGVGRLAPMSTNNDQYPTKLPSEEVTREEISSSPRYSGETRTEVFPKSRVAKELEDLEPAKLFVPEVDFHDPTIEGFIERSKGIDEVEALPSTWRKFRRHGRTGRNHGGYCSAVEEIDDSARVDDERLELAEEKPRMRREAGTEMEKIAASKNVREGRLGSPDSWSKQPLSVEFRHRTKLEEAAEEEEKSLRNGARGLEAPRVDFVTSNRRSFSENRESRDMPVSLPAGGRSYDEMPIYRDTPRDRYVDSSRTRGPLFYPERYRTERDYFVRPGTNEPTYRQDRYRLIDFDIYGRERPVQKPKRIIYYATLPEVVRKPVDLRTYSRPYDTITRSSNAPVSNDLYYKRRSVTNDPAGYRYYAYPRGNYESYDLFAKRPSWNERSYGHYAEIMEDSRRREQDLDHASMKDTSRNEEAMPELGHDRKIPEPPNSRDQDEPPWPVKIGTELSVKENNRITGRKIFGQRDDYDGFRDSARLERERQQFGSSESKN